MKILIFTMKTCNPCKALKANLQALNLVSNIEFIDVEENLELTKQYNIRSVPCTILIDNDKVITKIQGSEQLKVIKKIINEVV